MADVSLLFDWKPPGPDDMPKYAAVRQAAIALARTIVASCPDGADRATAIFHLRTAWFFANEAIQAKGGT